MQFAPQESFTKPCGGEALKSLAFRWGYRLLRDQIRRLELTRKVLCPVNGKSRGGACSLGFGKLEFGWPGWWRAAPQALENSFRQDPVVSVAEVAGTWGASTAQSQAAAAPIEIPEVGFEWGQAGELAWHRVL